MAVMDVTEEMLEKRSVWKLRYLFLQKPFFILLSRFLCITVGLNLRNMHHSLCFSLKKPFKNLLKSLTCPAHYIVPGCKIFCRKLYCVV